MAFLLLDTMTKDMATDKTGKTMTARASPFIWSVTIEKRDEAVIHHTMKVERIRPYGNSALSSSPRPSSFLAKFCITQGAGFLKGSPTPWDKIPQGKHHHPSMWHTPHNSSPVCAQGQASSREALPPINTAHTT
eukprot:4068957-Ditylum_brightwellii.AAC.1